MSEDMQELLDLLKSEVEEMPEGLEDEVKDLWPDTGDLFTQEDVDDIVERRLARERNARESEIEDLQGQLEDMVDPSEHEELKNSFKEYKDNSTQTVAEIAKEERLRSQAVVNGVRPEAVDDFVKTVDKSELEFDADEQKVNGIDGVIETAKENKDYFFGSDESEGEMGSDFSGEGEGDNYFTREQVEKMDEDEMMDNYEEIQESQKHWE